MEQMYNLHTYCNLSLDEMLYLTAEDREWWLKKYNKETEERNNAMKKK